MFTLTLNECNLISIDFQSIRLEILDSESQYYSFQTHHVPPSNTDWINLIDEITK